MELISGRSPAVGIFSASARANSVTQMERRSKTMACEIGTKELSALLRGPQLGNPSNWPDQCTRRGAPGNPDLSEQQTAERSGA